MGSTVEDAEPLLPRIAPRQPTESLYKHRSHGQGRALGLDRRSRMVVRVSWSTNGVMLGCAGFWDVNGVFQSLIFEMGSFWSEEEGSGLTFSFSL